MGSTYIKKGEKIIELPSNDALCEIIREKLDRQEELINHYKTLYEEAKSQTYKDEELLRLDAENKELRSRLTYSFEITPEEQNKINNWIQHHEHDFKNHLLDWSHIFTRTPIGVEGKVRCSCGKEFIFKELK